MSLLQFETRVGQLKIFKNPLFSSAAAQDIPASLSLCASIPNGENLQCGKSSGTGEMSFRLWQC